MSHSTKNISRDSSKNRKAKRQATWARAQKRKEDNIFVNEVHNKLNLDMIRENNIPMYYTFRTTGKHAGSTQPVSPSKRIRIWRRAQDGKTQHATVK